MDTETVRKLVEDGVPEADVEVVRDDHDDERSEGAHFGIVVESPEFAELSKVDRHRMVHAALGDHLGEEIHAVEIRAVAPGE